MAEQSPKMSYSATLFRVRVDFSKKDAMNPASNPQQFVDRALSKMQATKEAGQIADFISFEKKFLETWKALAASDENEQFTMSMTIAGGFPKIDGVTINKPAASNTPWSIQIQPPDNVSKVWQLEWLRLAILKQLQDQGCDFEVSPAKIFSVTQRAMAGEVVAPTALTPSRSLIAASEPDQPFSIVANKTGKEIVVVINNPKHFQQQTNAFDELIIQVQRTCQKINEDGAVSFKILRQDLISYIKSSLMGPERVGINLPMIALAAVGSTVAKSKGPAAATAKKIEKKPTILKFAVDEHKMAASIMAFDLKLYDDKKIKLDANFVKTEVANFGICHGVKEEYFREIQAAIEKKEDLTGKLVASGTPPQPMSQPFIYPLYKDQAKGVNLDKDQLDLRDQQQRNVTKAGQLFCEVRYKVPAKPGTDIFNASVAAPSPAPLVVKLGENVQEKERGKFYSTVDGVPVIGETEISVTKVLVHNGDVNLKSGNIKFNGPVEINGSIDTGAVVDVSGSITVHGSIRGGFVRSGDNITVDQGIVTGNLGVIRAKNNISADFSENSILQCGGELRVRKALLNCTVIVGKAIIIEDPRGTLGGGYYSARKVIKSGNIGFKNGAKTELNVGADYSIELALIVRRRRLEKISAKFAEDKLEQKELGTKQGAQLTKKHTERKKILIKRLNQARRIVDKLTEKIKILESKITYDQDAKIIAHAILCTNTKVTIAGNNVVVESDVMGVMVTGKQRRGTFIHALEEGVQDAKKEQEAKEAAAAEASKAAKAGEKPGEAKPTDKKSA